MNTFQKRVQPHQKKKVRKGIRLLNRKFPNWRQQFTLANIRDLDINNPDRCILAILNSETHFYETFQEASGLSVHYASQYGFIVESSDPNDLQIMNALWRSAILHTRFLARFSLQGCSVLQCSHES